MAAATATIAATRTVTIAIAAAGSKAVVEVGVAGGAEATGEDPVRVAGVKPSRLR